MRRSGLTLMCSILTGLVWRPRKRDILIPFWLSLEDRGSISTLKVFFVVCKIHYNLSSTEFMSLSRQIGLPYSPIHARICMDDYHTDPAINYRLYSNMYHCHLPSSYMCDHSSRHSNATQFPFKAEKMKRGLRSKTQTMPQCSSPPIVRTA